jgi:hypothetical protein
MTTSKCRTCGAPIIWVKTEYGKAIPLDADPRVGGNVQLLDAGDRKAAPENGIAHVIGPAAIELFRRAGVALWVSHFSTCPQAAQHRRKP